MIIARQFWPGMVLAAEMAFGAPNAEGALEGADACRRRIGRQNLVAALIVREMTSPEQQPAAGARRYMPFALVSMLIRYR
jgi:hypothetical protein